MSAAFNRSPKPLYSPWGEIQHAEERVPGIWQVSTAGHGGMILSDERAAAMPHDLLAGNWLRGNYHYEEDCDWSRPVIAFHAEFDDATVAAAFRTLRSGYQQCTGLQAYLDTCPARIRAEGYEKATIGMWEPGSMSTGGNGWRVTMYQKGSDERRTVDMPKYPDRRLYTTAELDAMAQRVAA